MFCVVSFRSVAVAVVVVVVRCVFRECCVSCGGRVARLVVCDFVFAVFIRLFAPYLSVCSTHAGTHTHTY